MALVVVLATTSPFRDAPVSSWGPCINEVRIRTGGRGGFGPKADIQRGAKKIKLSSLIHVPSGLMGCASAALGWWEVGRR